MRQRLAQRLLVFTLAFVSADTAFAAGHRPITPDHRPVASRRPSAPSPRSGSVTPIWGHFQDPADSDPADSDGSSGLSAGAAIPEDSDSDTGSCSGHADRCFAARECALNNAYKAGNVDGFVTALNAIKRADDGLSVGTFLRLSEAILQKASKDKIPCDDNSLFNIFDALICTYKYVVGFDDLSEKEINEYFAYFSHRLNNMAPPKSARFKDALKRFWPACAEHISATLEHGFAPVLLKRSAKCRKFSATEVLADETARLADELHELHALHLASTS